MSRRVKDNLNKTDKLEVMTSDDWMWLEEEGGVAEIKIIK